MKSVRAGFMPALFFITEPSPGNIHKTLNSVIYLKNYGGGGKDDVFFEDDTVNNHLCPPLPIWVLLLCSMH